MLIHTGRCVYLDDNDVTMSASYVSRVYVCRIIHVTIIAIDYS